MRLTRPHTFPAATTRDHLGPRARALALATVAGLVLGPHVTPAVAVAHDPTAPRARVCQRTDAGTYTVAAGDSWFAIATAAGTTASTLLAANDAPLAAALHPGDVLCLPPGAAAPAAAPACERERPVERGDSWFGIARALGVPMSALLAANQATESTILYEGDAICLPPGAGDAAGAVRASERSAAACASTHTVVAGDSWSAIASGAGLRLGELLSANQASASEVLQPGDELCLPEGAAPVERADRCVSSVTVEAGDSWYAISRRSGAPLPALYAANDASGSTMLVPGDRVCVPEVGFGRGHVPGTMSRAPLRGSCWFANSWGAARSGGRRHEGVDLIAPTGTPVVAVADGTLTRQSVDQPGARSGNAWWLTTSSGTYFFYAHLAGFAPGLAVGDRVAAGDVIGYVGSTGNAVSPHLHFELHPYGGGPVNPYDAVWMAGGCVLDRRYEQTAYS